MTEFDFDRAFPETPAQFHESILTAFEKGAKIMKMRHKMMSLAAAAAVLVIIFAMAALAGDLTSPKPDVLTAPSLTPETDPLQTDMPPSTVPSTIPPVEEPTATPTPPSTVPDTATPTPPSTVPDTATPTPPPTVPDTPVITDTPEIVPTATPFYVEWVYYSETCAGHDHAEVADCEGFFYHLQRVCNSQEQTVRTTRDQAEQLGLTLCEVCRVNAIQPTPTLEMARPTPTPMPSAMPGEGETEIVLYATEYGTYYHLVADCSGMRNASPMSMEQAELSGKPPCPTCISGPLVSGNTADRDLAEEERLWLYSEDVFAKCFGVPVEGLASTMQRGAYQKEVSGDTTMLRVQWRDGANDAYQSSYWLACHYNGLQLESVTAEVRFKDREQVLTLMGGPVYESVSSAYQLSENFLGQLGTLINSYDPRHDGWSAQDLNQLTITLDAQLIPIYCEFSYYITEGSQGVLTNQLWQVSETADPKLHYFDYDALLG